MEDFEYRSPESLDEALTLLRRRKKTKALAGGTDLVVQMKDLRVAPTALVDVKNIPELNRLEVTADGTLHVGAAVSLSRMLAFAPVKQKYTILYQACSLIGSMQIRSRATMGGNICNAAPSADSAPALICLGGKAVAASLAKGTRTLPVAEFFRGPGRCALEPNELLVELEIPSPPRHSGGCYLRHTTREEMDIAVVGVGVVLTRDGQPDRYRDVKISLGAVAPTPIRVPEAESLLAGKTLDERLIGQAAEIAAGAASPISDVRASADYRRELIKVLVKRAIAGARQSIEESN